MRPTTAAKKQQFSPPCYVPRSVFAPPRAFRWLRGEWSDKGATLRWFVPEESRLVMTATRLDFPEAARGVSIDGRPARVRLQVMEVRLTDSNIESWLEWVVLPDGLEWLNPGVDANVAVGVNESEWEVVTGRDIGGSCIPAGRAGSASRGPHVPCQWYDSSGVAHTHCAPKRDGRALLPGCRGEGDTPTKPSTWPPYRLLVEGSAKDQGGNVVAHEWRDISARERLVLGSTVARASVVADVPYCTMNGKTVVELITTRVAGSTGPGWSELRLGEVREWSERPKGATSTITLRLGEREWVLDAQCPDKKESKGQPCDYSGSDGKDDGECQCSEQDSKWSCKCGPKQPSKPDDPDDPGRPARPK